MFKKEKGITLIALIVTIVVLIILAGITITGTIQGVDQANNNKLITDLDKVHHAITERDSKYKLTKDESLLIGTVVKSSNIDVTGLSQAETITWKMLDFDGVTDPERDYYRLSGSDLVELGLTSDPTTTTVYVVNYFTGEAYNETQKKTEDGKLLYVTSTTEQVSEMGDEIIKDGLLVWYDGENNTGSGHSSTTTVWKDLSGNGRDGVMNNTTIGNNYVKFEDATSSVNIGMINNNYATLNVIFSIKELPTSRQEIISNVEGARRKYCNYDK
ncbi:MAG: type II secretion system protein [Clostridia bacterium]|nr:type II secretion system protein [Clostridia bacterium]